MSEKKIKDPDKQIKFRVKSEEDLKRYQWALYCHGIQTDQEAGEKMFESWIAETEAKFGKRIDPAVRGSAPIGTPIPARRAAK